MSSNHNINAACSIPNFTEQVMSFEEVVIDIWQQIRLQHPPFIYSTYERVAHMLNYNIDGNRVLDQNGKLAPWVDASEVRNIIDNYRRRLIR